MIHILGNDNSIINQYISEIRNIDIQDSRMRFRRNLERISELTAYEISKHFDYEKEEVETPLGISEISLPRNEVVVASIMRAGLPMHNGFLNIFDHADNAFISAYRKYNEDGDFEIHSEYVSCPPLHGKTLIIVDPMLATGASMLITYKALLERGTPKHTHIVSIIASREGVDYIQKHFPDKKYTLWLGAVDDELTAHAYIVPGLGDAGDLAFGAK